MSRKRKKPVSGVSLLPDCARMDVEKSAKRRRTHLHTSTERGLGAQWLSSKSRLAAPETEIDKAGGAMLRASDCRI